jgi:GNAT superfamily N-acetyltransferase
LEIVITNSDYLRDAKDTRQTQQNKWDVVDYLQRQIANPDCHDSFWFNLATVVDENHKLFVARDKQEGKLLGYLVGKYHVEEMCDGSGKCAVSEIFTVETCEGWRNRGVGRQLVGAFEKYSTDKDHRAWWIDKHVSIIMKPHEQLIEFLEKMGYRRGGNTRCYVKELSPSGSATP